MVRIEIAQSRIEQVASARRRRADGHASARSCRPRWPRIPPTGTPPAWRGSAGRPKAWALRLPSSLRAKSITDRCARNAASLSSNCCNAARLRTLGVGRKALRKDSIVGIRPSTLVEWWRFVGCTYSACIKRNWSAVARRLGRTKQNIRCKSTHRTAEPVASASSFVFSRPRKNKQTTKGSNGHGSETRRCTDAEILDAKPRV